ncbi:LARGE xylosyl- and glucuronyltransferase 2 [Schistosoma haematobium]|uniref:LARGE xylosyl- and glucuronyltransferase 2 n=1 Tax=Schistosoma haematobium TaxID=6185 RepID=A0A094ZSP0_SCHHA|nr:LARGE xylosyl- and glucuronyltransferase 2 [Schistosoma haematobium]KAH9581873.1 LARGE xylosyl- and glucuronyltransferase 2 [Schistosoma haematobium]
MIIILITWSIIYVITPNPTTHWIDDPLTKNSSSEKKIHIVILFDGDRGLQYLNSLLKSIFYHQNGRFRCDLKACCHSNFCDRFMNDCQTVMNNVSTTYTTVFHFLITSISLNSQLLNLMNTWKLHNMEYHFYSCGNHLVIILDIDILLNTDIIELWNHFDYFKETQSIGIGLEQNPYFQEVMTKLESNWKGYGYNNGVLLLHLSKLRSTNWNHLWLSITRRAIKRQGYLITDEQPEDDDDDDTYLNKLSTANQDIFDC